MKNKILLIIALLISTLSFGKEVIKDKKPIEVKLEMDSSIQIGFTSALETSTNVKMDTVYIKSVDDDNRNKSKNDGFVKTYIPSIIALFVLFVTNLVVLIKIRIESKETLKREITIASIKFDNTRLEDFYDPIFTTLSTNEGIFDSFGPRSFPDNDDLRIEASIIWNKMVESIILPNNQFISEIITKKSHLINETDQLEKYLDFLKHAKSYEHFIKYPNSIHKGFKYNPDFKESVSTNRQVLVDRINELKQNLKINGSKKRS